MRASLLIVVCLLACSAKHRAELVDPDAPVRVSISTPSGPATVRVEVADIPSVIKQGLADRATLAPDTGMLFFMGEEKNWPFWMKNTHIPLDILWISKGLVVNGIIHDTVPMSEEQLYVGGASLYVLEVHAGWARQHGVQKGARVTFENIKL